MLNNLVQKHIKDKYGFILNRVEFKQPIKIKLIYFQENI